jgi:hypothetical protein
MNNNQYGEWVQEMIDYSKRQEKKIRFEIENEALAADTFQIVRVWLTSCKLCCIQISANQINYVACRMKIID